ncbi:hypothetical protein A2Z53_01080 [Candidatus Giovannonibacteria bacterium RIFCSPHIGHO2_02_42_15]|uniref:VIT family protein n=2 Tax=Candidatus Giovannoniibacteriota TaxID=1752738 RepID=A0A1F5VJY3_9BACT|nr:MAG: hypothetical protein UV11_C0007G0024 [Candidatus Giovannonibacteria bacterium GW2011_GWF2_42_19]OGF63777.1 MAG: hypothetical protein A2Z53_01080 [Candidatus Giovannonibacteria bacterium RIFCSPHIGHO2_02_42_15]
MAQNPAANSHAQAELLKDIIYAANDGIITTFAVAAGVAGGGLPAITVLILGFANLFSDGFSMAVSNYLGTETEKDLLEAEKNKEAKYERPFRNSIATFFAFMIAGIIPIMPFLAYSDREGFILSIGSSLLALFLIGALRALYTRKNWLVSGFEILFLGAIAASIAYGVGYFVQSLF